MKALIVYYSLEGSTKMIANELAALIGAQTLELVPSKAYPTGKVTKFLWGGKSSVMSETPVLEPYQSDLSAYDTIIIGTPVWAWRCTPVIRTFLAETPLLGKRVAAFACAGGANLGKTFDIIEELSGTKLFAKASFISPAEGKDPLKDEKLKEFADSIR